MIGENWQIHKPSVRSAAGLVAAQNTVAAGAGAEILKRGGNAVDAAVATAFALGCREPWMSGIGGGGYMVVYLAAENTVSVVDFSMIAPGQLDPARYPLSGGSAPGFFAWPAVEDDRNLKGYESICVPGAVDGLGLALETFGTISFADALQPAIALAEEGLPIDWYASHVITTSAGELAEFSTRKAMFLPQDYPPVVHAPPLDQSRLAKTLRQLAVRGRRDFYEGDLANAILSDLRAGGSAMTRGDLEHYRAEIVSPLSIGYRGADLFVPQQPVDEVFPGRSRHGLILWCPGLKGGSLMAMGQQKDRQGDLMVSWSEMPRSPGHVFYDRLQLVLIEGGFNGFAEAVCQPYYAARMGAPSVPPGRYFRMHLVGYFEGIDSERGLEWRCSDSLSLREFLLLEMRERVPDRSWLSRTRARLPHEVHTAVFDWVLALIAEAGLVKGERIGVDASTMEANAALRNIVRRDTGEGYRGMLERLAQESGIETPTAEDLARLDRKRKGKKLSNQDWVSRSDPEAKIAKMKDGTTHLAYKPEHAVDLDTGAVVAAELHPADEGDTTTLPKTLAAAEANLEAVDVAPTAEDPAECVTDKGYHSRLVLKALDDGPWKSRISEPKQKGFARWHGDDAARRAVTNNRTRLLSGVAREAFKLRAEIVERSFAHNLDRGGMRRTWLRGRENVHKRYLLHVAGHNLSLLMRQLIGAGTPKEAVAGGIGALFVLVTPAGAVLVVQIVLIVSEDGETAFAAICFAVA